MGQMTAAGIAAMFAGEPWHYVGEAGEPAFENGWENVPGDTNLAFSSQLRRHACKVVGGDQIGSCRIREPGVVDLHGVVQSGTPGAAIFTLPEGYRPTADTAVTALWALSALSPVTPSTWPFATVTSAGVVSTADAVAAAFSGQFFLEPASAPA